MTRPAKSKTTKLPRQPLPTVDPNVRETCGDTIADYFGTELPQKVLALELRHDRNRRPARSILPGGDNRRWSVMLGDDFICESEPVVSVAPNAVCPYQSAISKVIAILINSDFSHDEGFVDLLKKLVAGKKQADKKRDSVRAG